MISTAIKLVSAANISGLDYFNSLKIGLSDSTLDSYTFFSLHSI